MKPWIIKWVGFGGKKYVELEEVQAILRAYNTVANEDARAAVEKALDDAWERNG